ncbi:hypothetical protein LSCM1_03088 [Leishmania martiniquensis]|uniref:Uncharacterized protein n=1 Tax=Leishmania martiniquensis TaxID=1580590 RepID=A0A836KQC3_9TRYP|nr:hypothetical protein LSCM1_03088 [Leishmania martiniquensis]
MQSPRLGRNVNGALAYSQCSTGSVPADADAVTDFLKSRSLEGFAPSAYWGATGEVPPRAPDDVVCKQPYPFQAEINRKLVPFPKDRTSYPRTLDYTNVGLHLILDDGNSNTGGLNASQMQKLGASGDDHGAARGQGTDGLRKPRFLTLQTTNQAIPRAFDDGVLQALRAGQAKEDALKRELDDLEATPYAKGAAPDAFRLTSDDYCDFSKMDPPAYRQKDWREDEDGVDMYKSRYNNVEREGPRRRERTFQTLQRGRTVDHKQLRSSLEDSHKQALPQGYEPYSAKDWMSTTHREHAAYDVSEASHMNDRDATVPLRNTNYALSEAHEMAVTQRDTRLQTRNDGQWVTTYSSAYQDRSSEADVCHKHGAKSVFDIQDGIYTIDPQYHHPREDVRTGETYTPAEMVPGQYTTMYTEPLQAPNSVMGSTRRC